MTGGRAEAPPEGRARERHGRQRAGARSAIAVIPARGGSKGIRRKNLRLLAGKPLVAWTIEDALRARLIGRVIVSTEDGEIASVARKWGAEVVMRPPELARDDSPSEEALLHALEAAAEGEEPEAVVFLQATSPVRSEDDIDRALTLFRESGADSLLSVVPSHAFLWTEVRGEGRPLNHDFRKRSRRQETRGQYRENGSIYIFRPSVLREQGNRLGGRVVLYMMDESAGIDIDTEQDLLVAEVLLGGRAG